MSEPEEPRIKHWSEKGGVRNLSFEALVPQPDKHGLHCSKCQMYMKLLPKNRDIPATHWECRCKGISLIQRDIVFELARQEVKEEFNLHEFSYNIETRKWTIQSAEWISHDESRINAKRRVLNTGQRNDIIDELQDIIEQESEVTFLNFQDYFIE